VIDERERAIADQLARYADRAVREILPSTVASEAAAPSSRRRWWLAAAAVLVLVLVATAVVVAGDDAADEAPVVDTPDGLFTGEGALPPDRWRSLPPAPLTPRSRPTMVWTGSEVIVFGGNGAPPSASDGAVFDPRSRTWRPIDPPPTPTGFHPTPEATTGDRLVVIYQHSSESCDPEQDVPGSPGAIYEPASARWDPLPPAPAPLDCMATATWIDGDLHVWAWAPVGVPGLAYDPDTGAWRSVAAVPFGKHELATTAAGEVVAYAMTSSLSAGDRQLAQYDAAADTWTTAVATDLPWAAPIEPIGPAAGEHLVGAVLVGPFTDDEEAYDLWRMRELGPPVQQETLELSGLPDPEVRNGVMTGCGDQLVRWGGAIATSMDTRVMAPAVGSTFDPTREATDQSWARMTDGPLTPRADSGVVCGDGVLYLWGGLGASGEGHETGPDTRLSDGAEYRPPRTAAERQQGSDR
jgi:hypothetical protein